MDKAKEVCRQLIALSVAMGTEQKPERIKYYANELMEFNLLEIVTAIKKVSRTNKFFPQLGEIIEAIKGPEVPSEELAKITAAEIIDCISRFGSYRESECREFLGDKFQLVERFGGWQSLCRIENDEIATTRAQLRELAKSYIDRSRRDVQMFGGDFKLDTGPRQIGKDKGLTKLQLVKAEDI